MIRSTLFALLLAPVASAAEPEQVTMGLGQFLELYERTKDRPPAAEAPPREYALPSARYEGEVLVEDGEARSAVFDATVRVDVLEDAGWARVPLLPATVALRSARIDGNEAPIVIEDGRYTLVTDRRGAFDVQLSFATSVSSSEGASGFAFQLVPSGATEVSLAVPASEDLDFTVANARLQSERTEGGRRIVEATLPATGSLSVSWQREVPEVKADEPRIYAEVQTLVGVGDGLLTATSTIHHTILFAGVDTLSVDLPDGMTLLDVKGAGVRDWTVSDGVLSVALNYAAEGAYPLTLEMERVVGAGTQTTRAPIPAPVGVERTKGWIGVEARGNLEVASGDATGVTPVDVRSLPAGILGITGNPVLLGFKYLREGADVPLVVSEHEDVDVLVTLLDQARATTMWTTDGRRLTSVRYQVRNNRRQFLRLGLPEGAVLWSASVGGRAVQPARAADGRVMVPLVRSQTSGGALAAFDVEVVYVEDGEAPVAGRGTFDATLPRPDVPTTYVGWTVYAPHEARVRRGSVDGSLRHVEALSNPIAGVGAYAVQAATTQVMADALGQASSGGLGQGATPVPVSLPVDGRPWYFEKLLSTDSDVLGVRFDYRGL